MNSLNILHISDAHIQKKTKESVSEIVGKLVKDVQKVQREQNIEINLVCFTGDLIQNGTEAVSGENQMKIAEEILINPIIEELHLEKNSFIITPGNHEVDTTKIIGAIEKGLLVESLQEINTNISDMNETYLSRLSYFYQWIDNFYTDVVKGKIGYAFLREIDGKKIGIACIDSAWRSSGKGNIEKGILYIGQKQIKDLYKTIKDADIKICLMHHPIEWLSGSETKIIEKELMKFDIVLCGHVHENDIKQIIRQNMKTIYSIAGKIYPLDYAWGKAVDGYNGYSILNVDFNSNLCTIFLRTYYAKDRNDFDSAINLTENGKISFVLNGDVSEKQVEFSIVDGIHNYFVHMSETLSLIKEIDSYSPMGIEEVFVDNILSEKSEYVKESAGNGQYFCIDDLLTESNNIIILGKKESGKTTVLQKVGLKYIERYNEMEKIPIYIDMRYLSKKPDKLIRATVNFVIENISDNMNISKEKITEFINSGKMIFLIDNIHISDINEIHLLERFIEEKKQNKFILTTKEEFFHSIEVKELPEYTKKFKKLYIHSFGKAQIRELVTKWASKREDVVDVSQVVEKINGYCNAINFTKTPFNISIFMVLWDSDKNFIPQNEGIVMENYIEVLLEKLSLNESVRSTYSFKIKQHFLSCLAFEMFEKNEYYFSEEEFENFVLQYHKTKGYKESDSKFSTLFFEKGILSISDGNIVFSHTSILEFYLAVYAINNDEFLKLMLKKGNRTYFKNELCFYSGLIPDCKNLLDSMTETIIESIINNIEVIDELNNFEIISDFRIEKDELIKRLEENRPTQKEIDDMTDTFPKEVSPVEFKQMKKNVSPDNNIVSITSCDNIEKDDTEDFYSLVYIYGSILKNAELLDNSDKIQHLENYMYAMNILLGKFFSLEKKIKEEITFERYMEENQKAGKEIIYEDFEKSKEYLIEMIKVALPIAIQQIILENIGTPKLEMAINDLMKQKKDKPFERFMLEFLKCDLNIGNIKTNIHNYINSEMSKSILTLILLKLVFYYRMRYFGTNGRIYNDIIDLIVELQIKLNPEKNNDLTKVFKGNKEIVRRKIASELDKAQNFDIHNL